MQTPRDVILAWVDVYNRRDADALAALYHEDAVNDQVAGGPPTVGRAAMIELFRDFFRAFPDNVTTPVNVVCEGEWVALEWEFEATWQGEFAGHPPSGKPVALRGCGFFRVTGGKIAFLRGYWCRAMWLAALGLPVG